MVREKHSHTGGIVFILGVLVLGGPISVAKSVEAETTAKSIQICAEIVYQGYVGVRKIVKIDSQTQSTQETMHLDELLKRAKFFNLPEVISSPKFDGCCDRGFPDFRITARSPIGKLHFVAINTQDVVSPKGLVPLLQWLEGRAKPSGGVRGRSTNEKCPH
jgi:hypothetical protein